MGDLFPWWWWFHLTPKIRMVSPYRTFCLALTSSVFTETTGSNRSGTLNHIVTLGLFLFHRYTLRCLVAVPQDTDCVTTIKTTEEKLANKKKELEVFQVLQKAKSVMPKCLTFSRVSIDNEMMSPLSSLNSAR